MKIKVFAISVGVVLLGAAVVYSHCHNDATYENPLTVRGNKVWSPDHKEDGVYVIDYWINSDKPGMPPLESDVKEMADEWSDVSFQNHTIKFRYWFAGRSQVTLLPTWDNKNVVGWKDLGEHNPTAGKAYIEAEGNRIDEVDIGLNYYKPFRNHAQAVGTTYVCLREIVVHEFGHMAGLEDVYFDPDPNAPEDRKCRD